MFERLNKVFSTTDKPEPGPAAAAPLAGPLDAVGDWAKAHGFSSNGLVRARVSALRARSATSRGNWNEVTLHATTFAATSCALTELKVNGDAAVLIMNRPLKEAFEKKAYEMYTDTLQTTADPSLPEELRWLAMHPEADWGGRVADALAAASAGPANPLHTHAVAR